MTDKLILESAPHDLSVATTGRIMRILILTLIPALCASVWFYGWGIVVTTLVACLCSCAAEAVCLKLRGRRLNLIWRDSSALVTGVILGFTLPPLTPWYLTAAGAAFAVVVAKHMFGGLGQNLFNPAMAGFVFLLISCPLPLTTYVHAMPDAYAIVTPARAAAIVSGAGREEAEREIRAATRDPAFMARLIAFERGKIADGFTGSTFLIDAKHRQPHGDVDRFTETAAPDLSSYALLAKFVCGLCFLLGGALLLVKNIIDFRVPLAFLAVSTALAWLFHRHAPGVYPDVFRHLFFGATLFGAFYVMTDPVTAVSKPSGAYVYGAVIGVLFIVIRNLGGYPDAVGFSVLLGNAAAPLIFVLTRRREFGQGFAPESLDEKKR